MLNRSEADDRGYLVGLYQSEIDRSVLFDLDFLSNKVVLDTASVVGPNCVIEEGVHLGIRTRISSGVRIEAGCSIGDDSFIGANVVMRPDVHIGSNSLIGHNTVFEGQNIVGTEVLMGACCYITRGVNIGKRTFIGPAIVTANDYPMVYLRPHLIDKDGWCEPPIVGMGVRIGAGVLLMPRSQIGDNAVIGAGSLVMGEVEENIVVAGRPAYPIGEVPIEDRLKF